MVVIGVAVQEAYCDGVELAIPQRRHQRAYRRLIEFQQYRPVGGKPLRHGEAVLTADQWFGPFHIQVVLFEAMLIGNFDGIAKPVGRHQRGMRALAFDQGIGRQRRAMDDQRDIGRRHARAFQDFADPFQHRAFRCRRCGQQLETVLSASVLKNNVGEGATNIYRQPRATIHAVSCSFLRVMDTAQYPDNEHF